MVLQSKLIITCDYGDFEFKVNSKGEWVFTQKDINSYIKCLAEGVVNEEHCQIDFSKVDLINNLPHEAIGQMAHIIYALWPSLFKQQQQKQEKSMLNAH